MSTAGRKLTVAERRAAQLFLRGGCVRRPNEDRLEEGHRVYKKGWEVRLYVASRAEAAEAAKVLTRAGLRTGRPYHKTPGRWILPLYSKEQVRRFLTWVDDAG